MQKKKKKKKVKYDPPAELEPLGLRTRLKWTLDTKLQKNNKRSSMFLYLLIFMAYFGCRKIPRSQRIKFQIVNVMFTALVLGPQLYVLTRPKSSRYCKQPLLNNLSASIVLSCIAAGFSVVFTLLEPVPLSVWRCYYMFGLLSFGHGLSTVILTSTAASCAKTTPELYYMSLVLTVASVISTGFFVVKCALWLINRLDEDNEQEVASAAPP